MSSSSRTALGATALAMACLSLHTPTAHAAACCVGATSALPTRVGECERGVAAIGVRAETVHGWWDADGRPTEASGYSERSTIASAGVGVRLSRAWELQGRVPFEHHIIDTTPTRYAGGGVADIRAMALWDPLEERPPGVRGAGPTPIGIVGIRLPTGRDWTASSDPMNTDVTGLEHAAVVAGGQFERTMGLWPWSAGGVGELDLDGTTGLTGTWQSTATFGRYLGTGWTLLGAVNHTVGRADVLPTTLPTTSTQAGARVVHGRPARWRAWAGVDRTIDLPRFGRASPRITAATVGYALVW